MNEILNKFLIYFNKNIFSYWNLTENKASLNLKLKRYPISIKQRIAEGHYPGLDERGIPVYGNFYFYTTICSYGLGNWELYLDTNSEEYLSRFQCVANYLLENITENGEFIQSAYRKHKKGISAMIQGEAISVLCRAWEIFNEERYLDAALVAKKPFKKLIRNNGVVGIISISNSPWYEEYVDEPLFHVLNGKIYSLWGLHDLWNITSDNESARIFDDGVYSLERNLSLFDNGFWSNYWHPENGQKHVASMMYHNLHICQLKHLARITSNLQFKRQAEIFEQYSNSVRNRFRSGLSLISSKIQNKINV